MVLVKTDNKTHFKLRKFDDYSLYELLAVYKEINLTLYELRYKKKVSTSDPLYEEQSNCQTRIAIEIANRLTST